MLELPAVSEKKVTTSNLPEFITTFVRSPYGQDCVTLVSQDCRSIEVPVGIALCLFVEKSGDEVTYLYYQHGNPNPLRFPGKEYSQYFEELANFSDN